MFRAFYGSTQSAIKPRKAYTQAVRTFALYAARTTEAWREMLDLCNGADSEKTPQFLDFRASWPAEYMTAFSGRQTLQRCDRQNKKH